MLVMGATNRPQELDEAVLRYMMQLRMRHNDCVFLSYKLIIICLYLTGALQKGFM